MSKFKLISIVVSLFIVLSAVFCISVVKKNKQVIKQKIVQIEKQIALDLPLLDLSNELLKHSGNKGVVDSYIADLNRYINSSTLKVVAITPKRELNSLLKSQQIRRTLNSSNGAVLVIFSVKKEYLSAAYLSFYLIFLTLSVLVSLWVKYVVTNQSCNEPVVNVDEPTVEPLPLTLIINLSNKTLSNSYNPEQKTCLANKPLCFYLALVQYCTANNEVALNHSKNVPDELMELANKYFHRLVELGHIVRKRPNFNNSLEKTLSEIRAALDEVLNDYPEEKELYYPPKAYGEGSRSRLHSYALVSIAKGNIEIIGK